MAQSAVAVLAGPVGICPNVHGFIVDYATAAEGKYEILIP